MRDVLGEGTILGYCTNVHAGSSLAQVKENLERYAIAVKRRVSAVDLLGIGMWLPHSGSVELLDSHASGSFSRWLSESGFEVFTLNGFPYGDFHQERIKHAVYAPDWSSSARLAYTVTLAGILRQLPGPRERSISTLPIGWGSCSIDAEAAATNLLTLVSLLDHAHQQSGVLIHVDLEPEPGCVLQRGRDVIEWFSKHLLGRADEFDATEELIRRHIRVCHDICHAAVMFEDQKEMFARYRAAGIQIGKVQIPNAVRADLRNYSAAERSEALAQLRRFSEDRYLHQTMIRDGETMKFFDDLPAALDEFGHSDRAGDEWRVHFHVPVYLESFGLLQTTRDRIIECFELLKNEGVKHWEVETYAWNVLPDELKVPDLADGIARELQWVRDTAAQVRQNR